MKVIFLDIDGVLNAGEFWNHDEGSFQVHDPLIQNLNLILKKVPRTKIVISSSWRYHYKSAEALAQFLEQRGLKKGVVIDFTPVRLSGQRRENEIQEWLDDHPKIKSFVVLDDDDFDLKKFEGKQLVKTTFHEGLTLECAEMAIKILEN